LEAAVKQLTDKHGAFVQVFVNEDKILQGIYFQDEQMKQVFSAYPELLCMDATYKLLELRFPLYVMLVEDGNGLSEIAAAFLLLEETEVSLYKMMDTFKKNNAAWESVRIIMTDKHLTIKYMYIISSTSYMKFLTPYAYTEICIT
jgi:zinc finger SWIM domain-containing protein 3